MAKIIKNTIGLSKEQDKEDNLMDMLNVGTSMTQLYAQQVEMTKAWISPISALGAISHIAPSILQQAEMTKALISSPISALGNLSRITPSISEGVLSSITSVSQLASNPLQSAGLPTIVAPKATNTTQSKPKQSNPFSGQYFKLQELSIDSEYKNLTGLYVDFRETTSYCAFIGLNGSGKSNVIEAISAIFFSLYRLNTLKSPKKSDQCPFEYKISYVLNEQLIKIVNGKTEDGRKVVDNMLPKNIIVTYSGDEDRLWRNYYEPMHNKFCSQRTDEAQGFEPPKMFYIDKSNWGIALVALLYSEDKDAIEFVASLFDSADCKILFEFESKAFRKWEQNTAKLFADELRKKHSYTISEFRELIESISFIDTSSTLFCLLYQASTGENDCLISNVDIKFNNGSNIEGLSEGEKKMILTNAVMHILATETSLTIFDEPDSHIHIARKSELVDLFNTKNRYSIVSTHSPVLTDNMKCTNLKLLKNGQIEDAEKLRQIYELSSGCINYMEGAFIISSKNVVVTEGPDDIKHIKKAIAVLSEQDAKYRILKKVSFIYQGGANMISTFYDDILAQLLPVVDSITFVFDNDNEGREGAKDVDKIISSGVDKLRYVYYSKSYPASNEYNFYLEDFYPKSVYSQVQIPEIQGNPTYAQLKTFSKRYDNVKQAIKKAITKDDFKATDFDGFKPFIDELLNIVSPSKLGAPIQTLPNTSAKQLDFWQGFSEYLGNVISPFKVRKAQPQHWYDVSIGTSQAVISFVVSMRDNFVRIDLYIPNNKELYSSLFAHKQEIESVLGYSLDWQDLPNSKASRIALRKDNINIENENDKKEAYKWLLDNATKIYNVTKKYLK